ncbi:MAG: hypothetical protein ABL912_01700 [Novosphingobium sp.]
MRHPLVTGWNHLRLGNRSIRFSLVGRRSIAAIAGPDGWNVFPRTGILVAGPEPYRLGEEAADRELARWGLLDDPMALDAVMGDAELRQMAVREMTDGEIDAELRRRRGPTGIGEWSMIFNSLK